MIHEDAFIRAEVDRFYQLRMKIQKLVKAEVRVKDEFHSYLNSQGGGAQELSGTVAELRRTEDRDLVRVADQRLIPPDFTKRVADKSKIKAHYKQTGELVDGVDIERKDGAILFKRNSITLNQD